MLGRSRLNGEAEQRIVRSAGRPVAAHINRMFFQVFGSEPGAIGASQPVHLSSSLLRSMARRSSACSLVAVSSVTREACWSKVGGRRTCNRSIQADGVGDRSPAGVDRWAMTSHDLVPEAPINRRSAQVVITVGVRTQGDGRRRNEVLSTSPRQVPQEATRQPEKYFVGD